MMAMGTGIYEIVNAINGRIYIGSAVNLTARWIEHRKLLRGGRHKNRYLQSAWNLYGEYAFTFHVLEECAVERVVALEQAAIDRVVSERGWDALYNINRTAGSRLGMKHTDEAKRKIYAKQIGTKSRVGKFHTAETKQLLSRKLKNPSPETRAKMSLAKLGKKPPPFSQTTRERMSKAAKRREAGRRLARHINQKELPL